MSVNIGGIIQHRRKQLQITQPHLAELANVNVNTIYRLERNEGNPTLVVLTRLAEVLGLELKLEVKQPL